MRKKILVLSSNGGYGHNAAVSTLHSLLENKYDLKVIYPIDKDFRSWGFRPGEKIYNTMLQAGWVRTLNCFAKYLAPQLFKIRKKKIERMIAYYLESDQFELVVSIAPFINFPASEAARKKNVPYLIITTDNDLHNWAHELHKVVHPTFRVTIGRDLPSTRTLLHARHISSSCIETIGLPIRPGFWSQKSLSELYLEYGISMEKPVILIMMGGTGAKTALTYAEAIGALSLGVHLIVCTGKNETLAQKLKNIYLHLSNSITVMGFTDKIADLMRMAHVLVTKPGPGTINEAIAMKVPVLIDNTSPPLFWEKANIDLVTALGIGDRIDDLNDLPRLLTRYLRDPLSREEIQHAFCQLPPNFFHEKIGGIIDAMCTRM